jgi:hypothetical protein
VSSWYGGAALARGGGAQGKARLVAALVHRPVVTLVLFPEVLRGGRRLPRGERLAARTAGGTVGRGTRRRAGPARRGRGRAFSMRSQPQWSGKRYFFRRSSEPG